MFNELDVDRRPISLALSHDNLNIVRYFVNRAPGSQYEATKLARKNVEREVKPELVTCYFAVCTVRPNSVSRCHHIIDDIALKRIVCLLFKPARLLRSSSMAGYNMFCCCFFLFLTILSDQFQTFAKIWGLVQLRCR